MPPPKFEVAFIWEPGASLDGVSKFLDDVADSFPPGKATIGVAIRGQQVAIGLGVDFSLYSRSLMAELEEKSNRSGLRFIELMRIAAEQRQAFREQFLRPEEGEPIDVPTLRVAARTIREKVGGSAPGPAASPPVAPRPPAASPPNPPPARPPAASPPSAARPPAASPPTAARPPAASPPSRRPPEPARPPPVLNPAAATAKPAAAPAPAAAAGTAADRRQTRYDVMLGVEFKTEADFVKEHATNISKGGLFIRSKERPKLDTLARISLHLPNGQRLDTVARVVHVLDHPEWGGIGLQFQKGDAAFEAALSTYLQTLGGK